MFELFVQYLEKMMPGLSKDQIEVVRSMCILRKLRKKQILLQEGEVVRYKIFVAKGLLRNYSIAENGYEYIVRFTDAGGWTTDPESYYSGQPSQYYIDAIEPSEVILFSRENFENLKQLIPAFVNFSERVITKNAVLTQKRVLMNISGSAEEKYIDFTDSYPNIFNRIPLHMVASYLGVSRETLTRIRQGLTVSLK